MNLLLTSPILSSAANLTLAASSLTSTLRQAPTSVTPSQTFKRVSSSAFTQLTSLTRSASLLAGMSLAFLATGCGARTGFFESGLDQNPNTDGGRQIDAGLRPDANPKTDGSQQIDARLCPDLTLDNSDSDFDGLIDSLEISLGIDPCHPDTDVDGVCDGPMTPPNAPCEAGPDCEPLDPNFGKTCIE